MARGWGVEKGWVGKCLTGIRAGADILPAGCAGDESETPGCGTYVAGRGPRADQRGDERVVAGGSAFPQTAILVGRSAGAAGDRAGNPGLALLYLWLFHGQSINSIGSFTLGGPGGPRPKDNH